MSIEWRWTSTDTSGRNTYLGLEPKILPMIAIMSVHRSALEELASQLQPSTYFISVWHPNASVLGRFLINIIILLKPRMK